MASKREQEQGKQSLKRRWRFVYASGQPNPEDVPLHPDQHKSGYGGELGGPRTSTDQRETPKKR